MKTTTAHKQGERVVFKDGQEVRISSVFTSKGGPVYLVESSTRAVFTCHHNEVRRAR